jgi:hypothetical protein
VAEGSWLKRIFGFGALQSLSLKLWQLFTEKFAILNLCHRSMLMAKFQSTEIQRMVKEKPNQFATRTFTS